MKSIFLILSIFLFACNPIQVRTKSSTTYTDSAYNRLAFEYDALKVRKDSLQLKYIALKKLNDSLKTELFLANYKIEKVKFYTKIVDRKPSQMVFFIGILVSFLFGLFVGKNNPSAVQKLGEEGEQKVSEVVKDIKKKTK